MKEMQEQIDELREQQAAGATAQAIMIARLDMIQSDLSIIRDRPPAGVPVWLLVLMGVPPLITSLALLVLVAAQSLTR